jgi:hypothetical protein
LGEPCPARLYSVMANDDGSTWIRSIRIYGAWERLVTSTPVVGKNGHDARLVAAMMAHGLAHLLTFNAQDFRPYPGITAVTPTHVLTP